jgi:hypothetical protein
VGQRAENFNDGAARNGGHGRQGERHGEAQAGAASPWSSVAPLGYHGGVHAKRM